jgi:hypothetical protein
VQIVRGLLRHETVTYRGRAFSADRVALEFAAPRPDMPIHLAAMADRSLALCGRLADGLIVSNLCPPAYTARAVAIVPESAAAAGREPLNGAPNGMRHGRTANDFGRKSSIDFDEVSVVRRWSGPDRLPEESGRFCL